VAAVADTGRAAATHDAVVAARAGIENLTPADLMRELSGGEVGLVDVREPYETGEGIIPSALRIPRGVLEFRMGSQHSAGLGPERRVVLYSGCGARSALAAVTLQGLGYRDVAHLDGGLRAWIAGGGPVQPTRQFWSVPVELIAPADRRTFVSVRLAGAWVGDLVTPSSADRDALLAALIGGGVSVLRHGAEVESASTASRQARLRCGHD
jgi:rhodanese-related sulfurtransferase